MKKNVAGVWTKATVITMAVCMIGTGALVRKASIGPKNVNASEVTTTRVSENATTGGKENQTVKNQEETTAKPVNITVKTPQVKNGYIKNKNALYWDKVAQNANYEVWISEKKKGKFKKISTSSSNRYYIKKLEAGKYYRVKVRAFVNVNKKTYRSSFSEIKTFITNVKLTNVSSQSAKTVNVSWTQGDNINGYAVQYSLKKNFKKAKTVKIKDIKKLSGQVYDLKANKKYYVRIRTFKKSGKKYIYSTWSQPKTIKVQGTSNVVNGGYKNTDGYFKNSVFFGDSVLQGLQIYTKSKGKGYLDDAKVMGVISYSLIAALQPESKYHPLYKGKHIPPQDVAKKLNAKKVFLFFGINDVYNTGNVKLTYDNYIKLINKIKDKNPDIKIHVISATPAVKGAKDDGKLTKRIHELNNKMRKYCDEQGYEYIDVASYVETSDGYLKSDLCSDGFIHQTIPSYEIWDKVLRNFAWNKSHN